MMRNLGWGLFFLFFAAAHAEAQAVRTFVATSGVDSNPCSRVAPCRNFEAALDATAPGGEVVVLDSGGYGAVVIDKSVTILAPASVHAAIAPTAGCAVTISAASTDRVVVRGIYLNSQGGNCGVNIVAAGSTHLETITVNGFNLGIYLGVPSFSSSLVVADSVVRNVFGDGIQLRGNASFPPKATIVRSRIDNTTNGLIANGAIRVTAVDTVATGNNIGFRSANGATLILERCSAVENYNGLWNDAPAPFYVSSSTISGNDVGIWAGGTIYSRGNNTVIGNGSDGAFTATFLAK